MPGPLHPLQAHLVLETNSLLRLILCWTRLGREGKWLFTYTGLMSSADVLIISDPEAQQLARELSERTGLSPTEVVAQALRLQLEQSSKTINWAHIDAICDEIASLPVLDDRFPEEIFG